MVATVHPLATDAGIAAFERGGNAVDAAVAAALTLGVADGYNSGIGGGCLILVRTPTGEMIAIDGREAAPARAHRDMFVREGQVQTDWSTTGPLAVATPGALAAYEQLLSICGRLTLPELLLPAAEVAEGGFPVTASYAAALRQTAKTLNQFAGSRAVLLKPDGSPYKKAKSLLSRISDGPIER